MADSDRIQELERTLAVVNATKQINKANELLRHKMVGVNIPYVPDQKQSSKR